MPNGDELKVAMLLLSPDFPNSCYNWNCERYYGKMREVAKKCLSNPEQINKIFIWDKTTRYLRDNGVNITRAYFEDYYLSLPNRRNFFTQVFKAIIFPPSPKPLEEWM